VSSPTALFSAGDKYERFMGRWSRELAPQLVHFAGVRDGEDVLDVGCGTGSLAAEVASIAPSCRVVGIDASAPFIAFAKARQLGERVRFGVGDAQHLDIADRMFDRTLSMLILNFVRDPAQAVSEMARVTRLGGIVAAAVWDYGDGMEMLRAFWDEAIALDPSAESKDERHMPLCRSGELAELGRACGLRDVVEQPVTISMQFASFDDAWLPFLEKQGPAGAFVAALEPGARDAVRARLRHRLLGAGRDRPIELAARAWAVRGVTAAR
jgi:SAM-dependent methyltransferase